MNIAVEIKEKLAKYPEMAFKEDSNGISALPDTGFTVWATDNGGSYTVGFGGRHEEFDDPEDAMNCFAWGLVMSAG